jgi:hypothetical protein
MARPFRPDGLRPCLAVHPLTGVRGWTQARRLSIRWYVAGGISGIVNTAVALPRFASETLTWPTWIASASPSDHQLRRNALRIARSTTE